MNWFEPAASAPCGRYRRTAQRVTAASSTRRVASLGSARLDGAWAWAAPASMATASKQMTDGLAAGVAPAGATMVRIPDTLIHLMAREARDCGRSESAVWAEAAREWLRRRGAGDEPQPPGPPTAALPLPRAARSWEAIDALLRELRVAPVTANVVAGGAEPAA